MSIKTKFIDLLGGYVDICDTCLAESGGASILIGKTEFHSYDIRFLDSDDPQNVIQQEGIWKLLTFHSSVCGY